jgi:serine protease Do
MTSELGASFEALVRTVRASTVAVYDERSGGAGSGVLWDARGLVVTNAHVVRSRRVTVGLPDGRRAPATLVGRDPERDLAVLRLETALGGGPGETRLAGGPVATVRDSATLVPGELVLAVGNPHGVPGAAASGLVHRCNARWVVADVRLAPGNSGGPLADARGAVVGINSMIARGLAFAVPSAAVREFLRALPAGARAA